VKKDEVMKKDVDQLKTRLLTKIVEEQNLFWWSVIPSLFKDGAKHV
jgi:hypothetical protein